MKKLLATLSIVPVIAMGQNAVTSYETIPSDDAFIVQDSVIVPTKKDKITVYHIYPVGDPKNKRVFDPKVEGEITFEGDFMYVHSDEKLRKYNRFTKDLVWTTNYGTSKWGAQCEPTLLGDKYVSVATDDHLVLVDKNNGNVVFDLTGKGFDCEVSISDDKILYSKWGGKVFAADIKTGNTVWSINVGEQAGFGNVTDQGKIYLPSWDPKFFCLDQKTGKKLWTLDLKKFKNGCGSGFEETPVLKGNKLYAVHRDNGLFIIDKETGEITNNIDEFGEIVDNIALYKNRYALFMDTDYFYIFDTESDKVHKKIELPKKMRTGFVLDGDNVVSTQYLEWKNFPYKKGIISIDLKEALK